VSSLPSLFTTAKVRRLFHISKQSGRNVHPTLLFCRKLPRCFAAKRNGILPQNRLYFAAKYNAICGKLGCILPQNATRFAAKCKPIPALRRSGAATT
jgi:hypothetical protein